MTKYAANAVYCHPERKRVALGLCGPCYYALNWELVKDRPGPKKKLHEHYLARKEKDNESLLSKGREYKRKLKIEVLTHYSLKGYLSCSCPLCDIMIPEFLSLDHIDGKGAEHRKELTSGTIYQWVRNNGFPQGFQTLCHNCNQSRSWKRNNGVCPHLIQPDSLQRILALHESQKLACLVEQYYPEQ